MMTSAFGGRLGPSDSYLGCSAVCVDNRREIVAWMTVQSLLHIDRIDLHVLRSLVQEPTSVGASAKGKDQKGSREA
jgi:hypothetical protein